MLRLRILIVLFFWTRLDQTMADTYSLLEPDVSMTVNDEDGANDTMMPSRIRLEAFRSLANDEILADSNANERYGELKWTSIGHPKLLRVADRNGELKLFHFNADGFYVFLETLAERHRQHLIARLGRRLRSLLNGAQISHLILEELVCSMTLYNETQESSFIGSVNDFYRYPLKLSFLAPNGTSKRRFLQQYFLENDPNVSDIELKCSMSTHRTRKVKNIFTLTAAKINELRLIEKLFGPLERTARVYLTHEQVTRLANEIYMSMNISDHYRGLSMFRFQQAFSHDLVELTPHGSYKQVDFNVAMNSISKYESDFNINFEMQRVERKLDAYLAKLNDGELSESIQWRFELQDVNDAMSGFVSPKSISVVELRKSMFRSYIPFRSVKKYKYEAEYRRSFSLNTNVCATFISKRARNSPRLPTTDGNVNSRTTYSVRSGINDLRQLLISVRESIQMLKQREIDSKILGESKTFARLYKLLKEFNKSSLIYDDFNEWTLLYRASRDGFDSRSFHMKCDNFTSTLTLIKANGTNYIFGGYARKQWCNDLKSAYIADANAFLFSLVNEDDEPILMDTSDETTSLTSYYKYGPTFGAGNDLLVYNESNTKRASYSNLGYTYKHPKYPYKSTQAKHFLAGSFLFSVAEIEVFQIEHGT